MIELSRERVEEILQKETQKTEDLKTILRGIYTRYMHLFEKYFADIDALSDDVIAELKAYHEETRSLVKYYYLDIPMDIVAEIHDFDGRYSDNMLGAKWRSFVFDSFREYREERDCEDKTLAQLKAAFSQEALSAFYYDMACIFRDGFGTSSQTAEKVFGGLADLLFGEK